MKTRLKTHYHTFSKLIFPLARKSMRNLNLLLKLVLSSSINNLVTSLPSKSISHWVWYSFRKSTKIKKYSHSVTPLFYYVKTTTRLVTWEKIASIIVTANFCVWNEICLTGSFRMVLLLIFENLLCIKRYGCW